MTTTNLYNLLEINDISFEKNLDNNCINKKFLDSETLLNNEHQNMTSENNQVIEHNNDEEISIPSILNLNNLENEKEYSSLLLLKYEYYLSKYLFSVVKNEKDFNNVVLYLKKIIDICSILIKRFNQQVIMNKKKNLSDKINRSSYKFCQKSAECNYYYDEYHQIKNKCNSHHFVHNIIYNDMVSLLQFIEKNNNENNNLYIKEIFTSINTINYVISHMYNELYTVDYYKEKFNSLYQENQNEFQTWTRNDKKKSRNYNKKIK